MAKESTILLLSLNNGEKIVGKVDFEDETTIILKNPKIILPLSNGDLGLASPSLIDNGEEENAEVNKALVNYKIIVNPGSQLHSLYIQATTNIKIEPTPGNNLLKVAHPTN